MKSLAEVAQIKDPMKRLGAASTLVQQAEAEVRRLRTERDLAILVMLRPFANAVAATNAERARLRHRLTTGDLSPSDYYAALDANRAQRQADIAAADIAVTPKDVYRLLGVSRNLVNRLIMRMPAGPLPEMDNPEEVALQAHEQIPGLEQIEAGARSLRIECAQSLMHGRNAQSNADIARATGLTTARITQLRKTAVPA